MKKLTTYIYIREDGKCVHSNAGLGFSGRQYEHDDVNWQPPDDWPYDIVDMREESRRRRGNRGEWISTDQLKEGFLYRIQARHARLGIWQGKLGGFRTSRFKFDANFIFVEIHWDLSESYGTAKPLEELEKAPRFRDEQGELDYLNKKAEEMDILTYYERECLGLDNAGRLRLEVLPVSSLRREQQEND